MFRCHLHQLEQWNQGWVRHLHRQAASFTRSATSTSSTRNVPRYVRRALQFKDNTIATNTPTTRSSGVNPRLSSLGKTAEGGETPTKRLLRPTVLSERLTKFCADGKVNSAVFMLKNAPLDAQNTPVWNTLIWECMKVQRFRLAYELFVDMKRRGFSPSTRTFQTMLSGLSRIEHWASYPKQLTNAHSLYDYFQRHLQSVRKHDPQSEDLSIRAIAYYLKILGDNGLYQKMFDVYYELDTDGSGPMAPDRFIYEAMFKALAERRGKDEGASSAPIHAQNASDARLLWKQMVKAQATASGFGKPAVRVDSFVVSAAINALSRGKPADQQLAFEIVRDYLGLTRPGSVNTPPPQSSASSPPPPAPTVQPLTPQSLAAALMLCNASRSYQLAIQFLKQIMNRSSSPTQPGGTSPAVLDRLHMEEIFKAYISLAVASPPDAGEANQAVQTLQWMVRQEIASSNPKIRPAMTTYHLVLMACWRGVDWEGACTVFEMMTGYKALDFADGAKQASMAEKRSKGRNLTPNAETLSSMLRIAFSVRSTAAMRQGLRMVDYFGGEDLLGLRPSGLGQEELTLSKKAKKQAEFYQIKLATSLVDVVDRILPGGRPLKAEGINGEEWKRWMVLKGKAKEVMRKSGMIEEAIRAKTHKAASKKLNEEEFLTYSSDTPKRP